VTVVLAGFLLGLASSLHCVAMCGPLILLATKGPGAQPRGWASVAPRLARAAWHHSGRIVMYGGLGLVAGSAGHLLSDAGLRQWVSIVAGALLTVGAMFSFGGHRATPLGSRWTGAVTRLIGHAARGLRRDRAWNRLALGAINGLLPCGLLYGALLAATGLGHTVAAGSFMVAFGFGSVPALATMSITVADRGWPRMALRRLSPIATAVVGLLLIARGLALPGMHAAASASGHDHGHATTFTLTSTSSQPRP